MTTTGATASRRLTVASSAGRREPSRISNPRFPIHRFKWRQTRPGAKQDQLLQELFSISRTQLVRVAYFILQNQEDAEDAVQDAFLSASRHFGNFEGRSAVTTWLTRIVINAALMMRRKRENPFVGSIHELNGDETVFVETIPDLQPNPESVCSRAESFAVLDALINKMNPLLGQAVKSTYYDELSSSEASSALAIPLSTYKARLFRGTHLLRDRARRKSKTSL